MPTTTRPVRAAVGSSSLKRMTDVTPAPAVSGLSLAIMLESKFSGRRRDTPEPARVSLWPRLSCPWSLGNLLESWLTVPTVFWNWRNFTASLSASVGSCPSPRLHSRIPHHFSCGKPPRTTSNRSPDVLLETRRRGRFGRVDMTGSYYCMSSPPEHVQYRLPDCPWNADLSAGAFLDFKATGA